MAEAAHDTGRTVIIYMSAVEAVGLVPNKTKVWLTATFLWIVKNFYPRDFSPAVITPGPVPRLETLSGTAAKTSSIPVIFLGNKGRVRRDSVENIL